MPEGDYREYFSLRYAVPGYTFMFFFAVINYVPLLRSSLGLLVGFFSLVTGSAIGFLISQFHYWRFTKNSGMLGTNELKSLEDTIIDLYHPELPEGCAERRRILNALLDFSICQSEKLTQRMQKFISRRWDMYHLLSSTSVALGLGWGFGLLCRVFQGICKYPFTGVELVVLLLLSTTVIALCVVLRSQRSVLWKDYLPILDAILRFSRIPLQELRRVFPNQFPSKDC